MKCRTISCCPLIPQRGNKDELHFTQDGEPHSALPANAWLDKHFPGWWIGRRGPTRTTPTMSLSYFLQSHFFEEFSQWAGIPIKPKNTWWNGKKKIEILLLLRLLPAWSNVMSRSFMLHYVVFKMGFKMVQQLWQYNIPCRRYSQLILCV